MAKKKSKKISTEPKQINLELPSRALTGQGKTVLESIGLSRREITVVEIAMNHPTTREIGDAMFITEKTVKFHFTSIFKKLRVPNRASMILLIMDLFVVQVAALSEREPQVPAGSLPKGRRS